jgi:hypothetical protein
MGRVTLNHAAGFVGAFHTEPLGSRRSHGAWVSSPVHPAGYPPTQLPYLAFQHLAQSRQKTNIELQELVVG